MSLPLMHYGTGQMATEWIQGSTGSTIEMDLSYNSTDHLTSKSSYRLVHHIERGQAPKPNKIQNKNKVTDRYS